MPAPKAEQDVNPFDFDPSSVPETNVIPENPFAYDPETKQTLIDTTEYDNLHDAKMVKSSTFTPGENRFGALGSFAADVVVSPAVGVSENAADTVKYYLGNALVSVPNAVRGMSSALPQLGALSALSEATGLNKNITTLGQHLANTETLLRMKQKDEERETRFENMGYEMGTLPGAVGKAVSQGVGQAALMAAAPSAKEPYLLATSAEAYRGKMQELAVAGEAPEMLDYARASGSAILNYAVERIGLDAITSYLKPLSERTVRGFAGRAFQGAMGEGTESAIQNIGEQGLDIGFGLKTPDSFDMNAVVMDGVLGMIGGGAGGLAYASAARKKLTSAYQDVLRYNGHDISVEDATDLAEKTLSGVAFDMTQYIRQKAGVEQSKINAVDAYHQALSGRPTTAEGIAPEDIERVANRKRDFDAIVDSVTATMPRYTTNEAGEKVIRSEGFSETAPEVAMKVKNLDQEITTAVRTIRALEAKGESRAVAVLRKQLEKTMSQAGLTEAQAIELQGRIVADEDTTTEEMTTELKPHITENIRRQEQIAKKIEATKSKGEQLDANLEGITQRLKDLRKSVRSAVKEGAYSLAAEYKDELNADRQTAKKERKATRKSIRKTFRNYKEAVGQLARLEKELPDIKKQAAYEAVDTLKQKYEDLLDYAADIEEWIQEERQADIEQRADEIDDLTEQYAELEQERKDILNGVTKPEGRIITTAAKIREFRLKSARDTLRNIAATRRVTKQEIAGTYNAVKRAIKSTRLPRDVKNGLIAKYAKANTYEELFEVYPAIQTAIDEALRVEQRKRAMRDIERSIFQLMRGKLGQDRAFGEALNQARRGEPTRPIAPHLDAFLSSVRYIYGNDALANDYVITLAEQLMKYRAESKQFLAEVVREREDKLANLLALTKKGAKGLKKKLPKGQLYESDPLIQTPGDGLLRAGKFSATLLRDFTLIGEDIKRAFDIHAPFFSKHMAIAKAKEDLRDVRRAAMPGKTDDQIDDILHADATQSADDPIFTRMVKSPDPKEPGMNVSVRYTPSQIRSLWSMTRNNEARSEFVKSGTVSEETIDEVEAWMNAPENARHKALAEGNMKLLERYAQRIQAMYADAFPLAYFSPIENYFMTARMYLADTEDSFMPSLSAPTEEGANRKALFATPKNLKGRTGSEKYRFVIPADTDSMARYIDSMEHFLAFGKYVNDLRAYLNEAETTLDVAYGKEFTQSMRDRVDVLESAQAIRNMAYGGKGLSKMIKNTASAVVRGVTQLVKQPVGVFTANIDRSRLGTSYAAAIEGIVDPKNADPIMRVIVKLKSIDPRYGDLSMFSPIITEYADTENTPKKQRRAHFWNRLLSIAPREGDRIAYYTVAHAKASELIDNGMNQDDAIAEGIREAEESQTTMNPARTPAFVAGIKRTSPVVANALKLQTTVLQMLDRNMMQMDKVSKYWATGNKKKAIAELADVLERWNFWVPFSYMVASGSVSIGEILKKTLTGPAGDVQVVGQIMDAVLTNNVISAINAVQVGGGDDEEGDKKEKIKTPYQNGQDLVSSAMDKARQNFMKSWKAFQTPDEDANEETEKDIIRGLMYAAEGASWIGAVAHGVQYPEFAKIIGNVYDNEKARMDMDVGYYAPLITSIMGYSSKKVEDLRKQLEEEKGGGEE